MPRTRCEPSASASRPGTPRSSISTETRSDARRSRRSRPSGAPARRGPRRSSGAGRTRAGWTSRCASARCWRAALLGAAADEVVVDDSTTVNLYRLAVAVLDARRRAARDRRRAFGVPDRSLRRRGAGRERDLEIRWLEADPVQGLATDDVARALGPDVALVVLSAVNYRSAAIVDIGLVTSAARDAGALVLWDLSHAGGSIPVELGANRSTSRSAARTSTSTADPARPPTSTSAASSRTSSARRSRAGSPSATSSRWARASSVGQASPAGSSARPGSSALPRCEAGIAAHRGGGHRRRSAPRGSLSPNTRSPSTTPGWRRSAARSARRATRLVAARTSRSAIPTLASSPASSIARKVLPDFRAPESIRVGLSPLTTSFEDVHRGLSVLRDLLLT